MSSSPPALAIHKYYKPSDLPPSASSSHHPAAPITPRSPDVHRSNMTAAVAARTDMQSPYHYPPYPSRSMVSRSPSTSAMSTHRTNPYLRPSSTISTRRQRSQSPLAKSTPQKDDRHRDTLAPIQPIPQDHTRASHQESRDPKRGMSIPPMSSLALRTPSTTSPDPEQGREKYNPGRGTTLPALFTMSSTGLHESPKSMHATRSPVASESAEKIHASPRGYAQLRPSFTTFDSSDRLPQTHGEIQPGRHASDPVPPPPNQQINPYARFSPPWTRDPERERMFNRDRDWERARRGEYDYGTPRSPYGPYHDRYGGRAYEPRMAHAHLGHGHPPGHPMDAVSEPASPPLRALPSDYPAGAHPYYPERMVTRNKGHSSGNTSSRSASAQIGAQDQQGSAANGQNRRIAHLMSEQKRRESINSGFTSLRSVLPNSIPTDSKAVVLRKAVAHIMSLENRLRKVGGYGPPGGGGGGGGGGMSSHGSPLASSWKFSSMEMDTPSGGTSYDDKVGMGGMGMGMGMGMNMSLGSVRLGDSGQTSTETSPFKLRSRSISGDGDGDDGDSDRDAEEQDELVSHAGGGDDVEMEKEAAAWETNRSRRDRHGPGSVRGSGLGAGAGPATERIVVKRERIWEDKPEHVPVGLGESFERGSGGI
ncbi:hypothetical protein BD324DRAFT_43755 [Kockovaella imperatae]|uniref:BHLH domain-containing protein n=1 Tax=Kockovaella imperatae TaxID=4999 RepID=A0A1Y1USY9_9TREE|nr:hypothetical protein BD324DRAFT_43755 [Kockovaella imperatae]ORX41133.1 hypothetical protein BD324DRAFT_43755 [Kockovaella imperatae]